MKRFLITLALAAAPALTVPAAALAAAKEEPSFVARFAGLALECVHKEYPNKISHTMSGDEDVNPPRKLTPVFFGCYDWHSSVHGHWLLSRLARLYPEAPFARPALDALARSFQPAKVRMEVAYLAGEGRASFERPYGLAWLLQLAAELRQWDDPRARIWSKAMAPLEKEARDRIASWLPKLTYPIRTGEHSQTAFAFGLILDWSRIAGDQELEELLAGRIRQLYMEDVQCPLSYEPSGQDFLSPCIAEADLVRRVLAPAGFGEWLRKFLPSIPEEGSPSWLPVAIVSDRSDPKLAHLDGLNLSRAWMLEGMASGLAAGDKRAESIRAAARAHRESGLQAVTGEHYEGGHWLGSFATYLVTRRGIAGPEHAGGSD